jgi:hypothetical protein
MFTRIIPATFVLALVPSFTVAVLAEEPTLPLKTKSLDTAELDRLAIDVLKELHDRGADLYNAADASSAVRLYEGSLRTIRPFLAHRPKVQERITTGLADVAKLDGAKSMGFRLHELIEQVRADLRTEAKPGTNATASKTPAAIAALSGTIQLNGKPLADSTITIVSLDLPLPRVFTTRSNSDGQYKFPSPIPAGRYVGIVNPDNTVKIPAKYQFTTGSTLNATVSGADSTANWNLEQK